MKKTIFILILLITSIFLFGCTDPEEVVLKNPEIANFIKDHPNAELIKLEKYSEFSFEENKDYWDEVCKKTISTQDFYKATIEDENFRLIALFTKSNLQLECGIIEEKKYDDINTNEPEITTKEVEPDIAEPIVTPITQETPQTPEPEEELYEEICEETWSCSTWSECINGTQERTCELLNNCGYNSKQQTTKDCNIVNEILMPPSFPEEGE